MNTGADSISTSRNAVRWKPIGTWDQGGSWAYRTPRDWESLVAPTGLALTLGVIPLVGGYDDASQVARSDVITALLWAAFLFLLAAQVRSCTEVDTQGITVVNGLRTHRVRWSDIDLVQLDGRPAITLLTKDRRITCWSLRQGPGDLLPWSRLGRRQCLEATADWMRHISVAQRSSGDREADYRRN